jgi:hypothetical protein
MGSASKIILIGATSMIVGIYAVSLKTVQTVDVRTALVEVNRIQFERVQAAAIRTMMSSYLINWATTGERTQLGSDTTFTYKVTSSGSGYAYVSFKIYQKNEDNVRVPRVVTVKIEDTGGSGVKQGPRKIHRAAWQVTKYYVQREL